jgi:hypothetical protein
MANCQSPQFCSQIPPRSGHVGRLVHTGSCHQSVLWESQIGESGMEWAPQLGRAPERALADARQSLNCRRAKSPHTTPAERPRRCNTTRYTFNLCTVIGESAAIATQGHGSGRLGASSCPQIRRWDRRRCCRRISGPPGEPEIRWVLSVG